MMTTLQLTKLLTQSRFHTPEAVPDLLLILPLMTNHRNQRSL